MFYIQMTKGVSTMKNIRGLGDFIAVWDDGTSVIVSCVIDEKTREVRPRDPDNMGDLFPAYGGKLKATYVVVEDKPFPILAVPVDLKDSSNLNAAILNTIKWTFWPAGKEPEADTMAQFMRATGPVWYNY